MAVNYRIVKYKNKSSEKNNWYYARAVMTDTLNLNGIAERIQRNCSMKKSDVLAVLTELVEVMKDELQGSHTVKLDGLGSFKMSMRTTLCETLSQFSASEHIKALRVLFQPEFHIDQNGTRQNVLISGAKVKEQAEYSK